MILYQYKFNTYKGGVKCQEIEVYETAKQYRAVDKTSFMTPLNKNCIGTIIHAYHPTVYLLERDDEKAKQIIIKSIENDIQRKEDDIKDKKDRIQKLTNAIVSDDDDW